MKIIFFDIETLPAAPRRWAEVEPAERDRIAARYKKPDTLRKKQEDAYRLTSLSAEFGRILCIGTIVETREGLSECLLGWDDAAQRFLENEAAILAAFWELLVPFDPARDLLVGHNIFDFDLKFIYQRCVVHRVKPTVELSFRRYQSQPIFDTMREWTKWEVQERISLERLALVLGLPSSKTEETSGDRVYDRYREGKFELIRDYCLADVRLAREIFRRLTFAQ